MQIIHGCAADAGCSVLPPRRERRQSPARQYGVPRLFKHVFHELLPSPGRGAAPATKHKLVDVDLSRLSGLGLTRQTPEIQARGAVQALAPYRER